VLSSTVNASVRPATPDRSRRRPSSKTPTTSAANTIGTTIMKISRRNSWPIGRSRLALTAAIHVPWPYGDSTAPSVRPSTSAIRSLWWSFIAGDGR
jgi:hypothetical protein